MLKLAVDDANVPCSIFNVGELNETFLIDVQPANDVDLIEMDSAVILNVSRLEKFSNAWASMETELVDVMTHSVHILYCSTCVEAMVVSSVIVRVVPDRKRVV